MAEVSDTEMIGFRAFLRYFTGPQLYKRYKTFEEPSRLYSPNFFEQKADYVISCAGGVKAFCMFAYPVLLPILYYKGYLTPEYCVKLGIFAAAVYGGSYFVRGLGRMANPDYKTFLTVLDISTRYNTAANKRYLSEFDFEFWAWPNDYNFTDEEAPSQRFIKPVVKVKKWGVLMEKVSDYIASVVANRIGISILYPGGTALFGLLTKTALIEGRTKIMESERGKRYKLTSRNNESVDCVFVDRRNQEKYPNGNTLIISCEGNAGFYEIGSFLVAVEAGYSVLGWNHPGFGGSTGVSWPENDAAAVEVVVQYAKKFLGFDYSNIIMFGWSIGGYSASWAAMNFRDIKGMVLDATFDDLLPLAVVKMPCWAKGLVEKVVRNHMNLPVSRQIAEYQGPVLLIRRTRDEIICTEDSSPESQRKTNRAAQLLKVVLSARYTGLIDDETEPIVDRWLNAENEAQRMELIGEISIDEEWCVDYLLRSMEANNDASTLFPIDLTPMETEARKKMTLFLATRYLSDFDSTHCTPLPRHMLVQPTHPWEILID